MSSIWWTTYIGKPDGVAHERRAHRDPHLAPVGVEEALLELVARDLAGDELLELVLGVGAVVRMREREERDAEQLVLGAAEHLCERAVHAEQLAVGARERHADRRVLERGAEALLGLDAARPRPSAAR